VTWRRAYGLLLDLALLLEQLASMIIQAHDLMKPPSSSRWSTRSVGAKGYGADIPVADDLVPK